ncbi:phage integrase N-terminal SAM-like domain-containing protein [Escherichia coli]
MKTATAPLPPLRSVKVLDQLRERIRYLHYSLRTEQAYVHWVRAFIRFHGVRHGNLGRQRSRGIFLSWLANERKVSVSTHRQALAALLFFYGKVLCADLPWLQSGGGGGGGGGGGDRKTSASRRLPVVLTPDEVVRILGFLEGEHRLFAQLLYGTGMRISEGLQLESRIWISITARSSCGRARAQGSGLDVTELGTQPARAAVACTGMVAEGPGRAQRRCASRRP